MGKGAAKKWQRSIKYQAWGNCCQGERSVSKADSGEPSVIANQGAGDEFAEYYLNIANNIEANIAKFAKAHNNNRIF